MDVAAYPWKLRNCRTATTLHINIRTTITFAVISPIKLNTPQLKQCGEDGHFIYIRILMRKGILYVLVHTRTYTTAIGLLLCGGPEGVVSSSSSSFCIAAYSTTYTDRQACMHAEKTCARSKRHSILSIPHCRK